MNFFQENHSFAGLRELPNFVSLLRHIQFLNHWPTNQWYYTRNQSWQKLRILEPFEATQCEVRRKSSTNNLHVKYCADLCESFIKMFIGSNFILNYAHRQAHVYALTSTSKKSPIQYFHWFPPWTQNRQRLSNISRRTLKNLTFFSISISMKTSICAWIWHFRSLYLKVTSDYWFSKSRILS